MGEVILTSGVFRLGDELKIEQNLFQPLKGWLSPTVNTIISGEYHAIGVNGAGIVEQQLKDLEIQLKEVKTELEDMVNNGTVSDLVTSHTLMGNILQMGILGYFAINDSLENLTPLSTDVISYRLPSYGSFSTNFSVNYSFGIPRTVKFPGLLMDVNRSSSIISAKDNSDSKRLDYARIAGVRLSAYEHLIPELLFSDESDPKGGISAVKALSIAAQQGQRIYVLTQANAEQLNNINIDFNTKSEIRNALNAGNEVTVSENQITLDGWVGVGYIIFDPVTGSGAYKISGGANGSFWEKYQAHIDTYLIELSPEIAALLITGGVIPKSWVGAKPLLGSPNPLTSILRAIGFPGATSVIARLYLIPLIVAIGTFIGFYNIGILVFCLIFTAF